MQVKEMVRIEKVRIEKVRKMKKKKMMKEECGWEKSEKSKRVDADARMQLLFEARYGTSLSLPLLFIHHPSVRSHFWQFIHPSVNDKSANRSHSVTFLSFTDTYTHPDDAEASIFTWNLQGARFTFFQLLALSLFSLLLSFSFLFFCKCRFTFYPSHSYCQ